MVHGLGIDIVENKRLTKKLAQRFLTSGELEELNSLTKQEEIQTFLGRAWSVKEAVIKATDKEYLFSEIEVKNSGSGKPFVNIKGTKDPSLKVSISHENKYTVAVVIWEK